MKNLFKEAHKMTREIANKYDVDYQAQFGLCLSYLLQKGDVEGMKELKGTEKQVKYANDIKRKMNDFLKEVELTLKIAKLKKPEKQIPKNQKAISEVRTMLESYEDAGQLISDHKDFLNVTTSKSRYLKEISNFSMMPLVKTEQRLAQIQEVKELRAAGIIK